MNKTTPLEDGKPDIKLVRALQADFKKLYVKEFTINYKAQRLIRNMEIGIMQLPNLEKYINRKVIEELKKVSACIAVDDYEYIDYRIEELRSKE